MAKVKKANRSCDWRTREGKIRRAELMLTLIESDISQFIQALKMRMQEIRKVLDGKKA